MKTLNKIAAILALSFTGSVAMAQQDPMFTHYMDNTLMVNPAYAGSRDALTITGLYRSQWVNYKGAPVTQTVTMHTPLRNEHIGLGLSVLNDKIGPVNNTSVYADFAFRMRLTKKSKLALGLKGGMNIYQARLNSVLLDQQADASFQNNLSNRLTPNFGAGVYYSRDRFYAGISVPDLLQNNYAVTGQVNGSTLLGKQQRHYFFIAGTMIKISDNLQLKPTTLVKVTVGAPVQMDLTASFIIHEKLLLGAMFRSGDAFGALVGFNISEQFHIGYSFDYSYGIQTFKYNQGSHEIILRYDFIYSSKKQIHSPRYF